MSKILCWVGKGELEVAEYSLIMNWLRRNVQNFPKRSRSSFEELLQKEQTFAISRYTSYVTWESWSSSYTHEIQAKADTCQELSPFFGHSLWVPSWGLLSSFLDSSCAFLLHTILFFRHSTLSLSLTVFFFGMIFSWAVMINVTWLLLMWRLHVYLIDWIRC